MKTIKLSQLRRGLEEVLNRAVEENVVLTTPDGRQFVVAEIDDFVTEVRLIREYREVMEFLRKRSPPARHKPSRRSGRFVYLEALLRMAKALSVEMAATSMEERVNLKIRQLSEALARLSLPRNSLPAREREDSEEEELCWLVAGHVGVL